MRTRVRDFLRSPMLGLPWWAWPLPLMCYAFLATGVLLSIVFACYGVSTTLVWQHVLGQRVTVVVTDCHDLSRNGVFCAGTRTDAGHTGDRVNRLPYDPASVGRSVTVWAWAGDAVVGTPWSALWFDAGTLAAAGYAVRRLRSRRGPATCDMTVDGPDDDR